VTESADVIARRLAAIVESSDDAIVSTDLNGIVLSWNQAAERTFGYTADEMIGSSIRRLIPEDRQIEEDTVLASIRAGRRVEHFETIRRTRDGRLIPISLSVSPILDANGTVVGASKIARDISDRKNAERQAARAAERDGFLA
jgi:PAS domain S-box-containing protein